MALSQLVAAFAEQVLKSQLRAERGLIGMASKSEKKAAERLANEILGRVPTEDEVKELIPRSAIRW